MTVKPIMVKYFACMYRDAKGNQISAVVLPALYVDDAETLAPKYSPQGATSVLIAEAELKNTLEISLQHPAPEIPNPLPPQTPANMSPADQNPAGVIPVVQ